MRRAAAAISISRWATTAIAARRLDKAVSRSPGATEAFLAHTSPCNVVLYR